MEKMKLKKRKTTEKSIESERYRNWTSIETISRRISKKKRRKIAKFNEKTKANNKFYKKNEKNKRKWFLKKKRMNQVEKTTEKWSESSKFKKATPELIKSAKLIKEV